MNESMRHPSPPRATNRFPLLRRRDFWALLTCVVFLVSASLQVHALTIYVSPSGSNSDQGTLDAPVETLSYAKVLCKSSLDTAFTILLEGGVTHERFEAQGVEFYGNGKYDYFGFAWDIDKPLILSTYGSTEKARLRGATYTFGKREPTTPILVYRPSSKQVLIENLAIEMWQTGAIMVMETRNVHIRNIRIDSIGTRFIPDDVIDPAEEDYPYVAGVLYPKNSKNILIEQIVMTNCHNRFPESDALHGFYCTRLSDSEIRDVYMKNVSGSPFKVRRAPARNLYIHNVEAYYTGTTNTHGSSALDQPGFLRFSGGHEDGCPSNITFEDSRFWYPYCWSEYEDCREARTQIGSISNNEACGPDEEVWTNDKKVKWIDVDFRLEWVPDNGTF